MPRLPSFFSRLFLLLVVLLALLGPRSPALALSAQEQLIANLLTSASGQQRASMQLDPILSRVAHERAVDMARRDYYDHVNPDGHGPNHLVRQAGYALPGWWPTTASANNIESINAGRGTAADAWSSWLSSSSHREHLLGTSSFYAEQTSYGVGYHFDVDSEYQHYWVVLTAPPGAPAAPALAILSPAENASLTVTQVTVSGSSGGTPAAQRIELQLQNSSGVGSFASASGTASWSSVISGLQPGTNLVRVRSIAANGSVLLERTRTFHVVAQRALEVQLVGSGTVTAGFAGTSQRELGRAYTIAAHPAPGWLFERWSGDLSGATPAVTFTMREGIQLNAHFVLNPFFTLPGAYSAVVQGENFSHEAAGLMRLTTTRLGTFSGRLVLGGKAYAVSGKFDLAGRATVTIRRGAASPLTVSLELDLSSEGRRLAGHVTDGSVAASFSAEQTLTATATPSIHAGRYTVSLPLDRNTATAPVPEGDGFATLTINPAGAARLTGWLPDGTAFSHAVTLSREGLLPVYVPLYGGHGSLAGTLRLGARSSSDLEGRVHWSKPLQATARFYPAAFEVQSAVVGSRYVAPSAGNPVLALSGTQDNATLSLDGGDLSSVDQTITIAADHRVTLSTPALPNLAVRITASTGLFSGSFTHPATGRLSQFKGAVLQKRNSGSGYFAGQDESGRASLAVR